MIEKGVEWLNQNAPDWKERVADIDVRFWGKCVLGKVYGKDINVALEHFKTFAKLQEYGFAAMHGEHEELNNKWKDYLENN